MPAIVTKSLEGEPTLTAPLHLTQGSPESPREPLITHMQFVTLYTATAPLALDCGRTLGPIVVAYETLGQLSPQRDNAVLICHALTGDGHVAGRYSPADAKPGWWDAAVGPGRAFDTDRYFVICANVLGGAAGTTGPSSINPHTGRPYGLDFPLVTSRDMVRLQARLLDHLGIQRLVAVAGGSLGAMQALEWAVTFPDRTLGVIPIAGAARLHPQAIAWNAVQREAILNDPNFRGGQYYDGPPPAKGLATARMLGMITYRSDESMWSQFGRRIRPAQPDGDTATEWDDGYGGRPRGRGDTAGILSGPSGSEFERGFGVCYEVESYLQYNGQALVNRFDANSYLYLSRSMDLQDIARGYPTLDAAYARITAETLVVGIRSDLLFPPYLQKAQVSGIRAAGGRADYIEMDSPWGHDAFLVDFPLIAQEIAQFLAKQHRRQEQPPRQAVEGLR